ncbi:MAG: selenocysteine-specific translation elongation factor [Candidatus Helarchaeota archaeon]|nr:selenocysteine-specific translation elongation factor [Candidatus Helarchaeota archaeon]
MNTSKKIINVVLLGHIDHGKTKLAEILSEKISTAGLDKHPEEKKRGISIDIGFTAFELNEYLITLVDAPGHADLIRNVVAASSISDAAILVIAADEGPMIQTGEHIVILDSFKIHNVIIALNKIDLVKEKEIKKRIDEIRNLLKETSFPNAPIIPISAEKSAGIDELKESLYTILSPPTRHVEGPFKMPIDHAFPIKGTGTVITGTIHRGMITIGDKIEINPLKILGKIKGIQIFKEPVQSAKAGDRVGLAIPGLDYHRISRGYYACSPNSLKISKNLIIKGKVNPLFKKTIKSGIRVHITIGMPTISALIYPFKIENSKNILLEKIVSNEEFYAYLKLDKPVTTEKGEQTLISRLELPPTTLRIIGNGLIEDTDPTDIELYTLSKRKGTLRSIKDQNDIVVRYVIDGLSQSKFGAEKLLNKEINTENGKIGRIISPFGTKGAVTAKFKQKPDENMIVYFKKYKKVKI